MTYPQDWWSLPLTFLTFFQQEEQTLFQTCAQCCEWTLDLPIFQQHGPAQCSDRRISKLYGKPFRLHRSGQRPTASLPLSHLLEYSLYLIVVCSQKMIFRWQLLRWFLSKRHRRHCQCRISYQREFASPAPGDLRKIFHCPKPRKPSCGVFCPQQNWQRFLACSLLAYSPLMCDAPSPFAAYIESEANLLIQVS